MGPVLRAAEREAAQLKREWVLGNDTVAEFWEDVKDSIQADFVPNEYLSMRYDEWLAAEHKGMRMQMSRKAFTARIVELACSDGEWTQNKDASGSVLKTSCEKWCPGLTVYSKRAAGFGSAADWSTSWATSRDFPHGRPRLLAPPMARPPQTSVPVTRR